MAKRKAASAKKKTRSSASKPQAPKARKPRRRVRPAPAKRARPSRTGAANTKTAKKKAVARKTTAKRASTRPSTRPRTPAAAERAARQPARARGASKKRAARRPAVPSPRRSASVSPAPAQNRRRTAAAAAADAPRLPLAIVDDPEDDVGVSATSSLDLEHRPRLPIALAEIDDEWPASAYGDASLKAGDADADSGGAYFTGDETPGGENPTPDQDVVDYIGRSLGVEYDDDEELQGAEKIAERDRHRWELNPASAETREKHRR